eukprot:12883466-Ditylum_brightwellii.AAC.1
MREEEEEERLKYNDILISSKEDEKYMTSVGGFVTAHCDPRSVGCAPIMASVAQNVLSIE